jgi:hypothetical protein
VTHKYWFIGQTRGGSHRFAKGMGTGNPCGVRFKSIQNNASRWAIDV